jgi:hypothetical protein
VLVLFSGAAVALTRWLDAQGPRAVVLPNVVAPCVGDACGAPDADLRTAELPSATASAIPIRPIAPPIVESNVEDAAVAIDARRADAGAHGDASILLAAPSAFAAISRSLGAAPGRADTDASAPPAASAGARKDAAPPAEERRADAASGVHCGTAICAEGQVCCNASCGTCRPPGVACSQVLCGPISPYSAPCGPNTCNVGEVCCNASCGICTPPGGTCSQQRCDGVQMMPVSIPCGPNTCNVGQVCCNASCGICTLPGESCRREPCLP